MISANPPSKAAVPVGPTSPIATRPNIYHLQHTNGTLPSSGNIPEDTSSSADSNGNAEILSTPPSLGQHLLSNDSNDVIGDIEAPSRDSWMALAKDSDSEKNNDDSGSDDVVDDKLFEDAVTMHPESSHSPTQRSIPWDEGGESSTSMASNLRSIVIEKENVEHELAEVRMDRDFLRQQLLDARAELESARSTLQENVSELEDQLRSVQQSERRQTELEENALLEEEIEELARLAGIQERDSELRAAASGSQEDTTGVKVGQNEGKASVVCDDGNGSATLSSDPTGLSSPASISNIQSQDDKMELTVSLLTSQEERSYKERISELEDGLEERKLHEQLLEKEVHQLKEQAQFDLQKFEEAQRQIAWFQQELNAMFPQQGEISSLQENHYDEHQTNAAHLETIIESNSDDKESDEQISEENIERVHESVRTEEKNSSDQCSEKISNIDHVDPSICVFNESINQTAPSSSYINFLPVDNIEGNKRNLVGSDNSIQNSSDHVKLLHEQRLELEKRVQELLDEIGTLRRGHRTDQDEKEQSNVRVLQLQTKLQLQKEEHRLELVLIERQLAEWKDRSNSFQTNFERERNVADQKSAQSHLETLEREELSQQIEELELQNDNLKDRLEKSRIGFEHEKGYLKKAMASLEKELCEKSADLCADISVSKEGNTSSSEEENTTQTQTVLPEQYISDHAFSRDEQSWKGLLDRIKDLEDDQKARIDAEHALREELKNITSKEKKARDEAVAAENRSRVLQTYLDASFSTSPKRERQLELEQEYLSIHSRPLGNDDINPEHLRDAVKISKEAENDIKSAKKEIIEAKTELITTMDNNTISNVQYEDGRSYADSAHRSSPESPTRRTKSRDIVEQSTNSESVVHSLHLKLEEEMGNLKKRKEKRRSRALSATPTLDRSRTLSATPTFDRSSHKRHSLVDLDLDTKSSDSIAEKATTESSAAQIEVVALTEELLPLESQSNIDQMRSCIEQNISSDRKEGVEIYGKSGNEYQKEIEAENSRLVAALEQVKISKVQLESQLEDIMRQMKDNIEEKDSLRAEIMQCRSLLDESDISKNTLLEQLQILQNEKVIEKAEDDEKLSSQAILSELKRDLDKKDKVIHENNVSHRREIEEMKKILKDSQNTREENDKNVDHINRLEGKILAMETNSKTKTEKLSNEIDILIEERDALELKFRDSCNQLDEIIENESSLKENIEKLESAQKDYQKLSGTKEDKITELGITISEKNQRIAELEKDVSSMGRRLEQAAIQMSELENELFERDEEIEKLEEKRHQLQDNASKQLVDMEKFLEKEETEIDRLEEANLKLQDLVHNYEHQIQKQVGRLAEASLQLSEMEKELFAKDDEIEEMELRLNAMQALEAQRIDVLQDSDIQKKRFEEELEAANQTIRTLTSEFDKIKEERESEKTEAQRLLVEDERKNKEILSRENQLNRQLQNVSKLTEQTDKWQLQLEKAYDEKQELLNTLANFKMEVTTLREELDELNEKLKEMNTVNTRLKDDLVCATEEDEKNRLRISQMEELKEALSQELESAVDNLTDFQKQNEEARELGQRLSTDSIDALQTNLHSVQSADEETAIHIRKLTEQAEIQRESLRMSEYQRSELESENDALKSQIKMLVKMNSEDNDADATTHLENTTGHVSE